MPLPATPQITILENGPYLVSGNVPIEIAEITTDEAGESLAWRDLRAIEASARYALCRCGRSANKPFCDGTHATIAFDGTETASRAPYAEQAKTIDGPTMVLQDAPDLCSYARFCDRAGTVWGLIEKSDEPGARDLIVAETTNCPSGRLTARDRGGAAIEPDFPASIVVTEDPAKGTGGPLWVRGGIPLRSHDGRDYETRNRVTLCRCGASKNKPFCDGSHDETGFSDGLI